MENGFLCLGAIEKDKGKNIEGKCYRKKIFLLIFLKK